MKRLLATLILLTASCFAQTDKAQFTIKATAQLEYASGFGVKNPGLSIGIRPEYQSAKHFLFLGELNVRTARKLDAQVGCFSTLPNQAACPGWPANYEIAGGADAYYDHKGILFGGGFSDSYLHTPVYSKNAFWPEVSGGYLFKDGTRITGAYLIKGFDRRNGLQGGEVRIDYPLKGRIHLIYHAGFFSFHPTDIPSPRHWGATVGGGIGICVKGCS